MKLQSTVDQIKKGSRLVYNDGRLGHSGVLATVLAVDKKGMTVQARFIVARRSFWQLLFDKVDNWLNPNLK